MFYPILAFGSVAYVSLHSQRNFGRIAFLSSLQTVASGVDPLPFSKLRAKPPSLSAPINSTALALDMNATASP